VPTGLSDTFVEVTWNAVITFAVLITTIGELEVLAGVGERIARVDGT
jgi:hypothetical protein